MSGSNRGTEESWAAREAAESSKTREAQTLRGDAKRPVGKSRVGVDHAATGSENFLQLNLTRKTGAGAPSGPITEPDGDGIEKTSRTGRDRRRKFTSFTVDHGVVVSL